MQEFSGLLGTYKKDGLHNKYKDQFFILEELDKVAEAFDQLNNVSKAEDFQRAM